MTNADTQELQAQEPPLSGDEASRRWAMLLAVLESETDARALAMSLQGLMQEHKDGDIGKNLLALYNIANRAEARLSTYSSQLLEEMIGSYGSVVH